MTTIYWHATGPLLDYDGQTLLIEDLNPHHVMVWRMSRWEMFKIGLRWLWASCMAKLPPEHMRLEP